MRSPRHRWNCVAQPLKLEWQRDGLTSMSQPDKVAKELRLAVQGKSRSKSVTKAYAIYQNESTRTLIEGILLATDSCDQTAKIVKERVDVVRSYADCFFDIAVFEGTTDKLIYLEKYQLLEPEKAQMLRNIMQMSYDDLMVVADSKNAKRVDAKTVIDNTMALYYSLLNVFLKPKLELIINESADEKTMEHFDSLFSKAQVCANMGLKCAELLLKYELDKSADNFLDEFALALEEKPVHKLIKDKPTDGSVELV